MKKRVGSAISDTLPFLIIAVAVLVLLVITIFILKGKGIDYITKIKELFRWG